MAVAGRIIFNRTTCSGIGLCEMHAPEFFEIADDGDGRMTLLTETVDADKRAEVEEAASSCPTASIQIVDL
jgi:ferredoxin